MTPFAYELGDRVYIKGVDFLVVGYRKMMGTPIEYCLRNFAGAEFVDMWMPVPEINAWREGLEEIPSV